MITPTRRLDRLAQRQAEAADEVIEHALEQFARQTPGQYRAFGVETLTNGSNWSGALGRGDALTLSRYLEAPTKFLVLTGPTGTGKSTAACALVTELIKTHHLSARFVAATGMLTQFSFGWEGRSAAEVLEDLCAAPILVIDDLGAMNDGMSDHQRRSLWSLIDSRWANDRITIITSNMALRGNRDGIGLQDIVGDSGWDRIRDSSTIASFDGESFRGQRA